MKYKIHLPENKMQQPINEEYFFITENGKESRIKLHDYAKIYSKPGLYEQLAVEILGYRSHEFMANFLSEELKSQNVPFPSLQILELGAGSGLFGREIYKHGIKQLIGIDITPEAAEAANYGDDKTYQHYFIEDFTNITSSTKEFITNKKINIFVCCSALSDGHIPISAFINGINLVDLDGWVLFNISKSSYENKDNEVMTFFNEAVEKQQLKPITIKSHTHRKFCNGDNLEYMTFLVKKLSPITQK
jgi:SAM-dependent MidA family methyltransferase